MAQHAERPMRATEFLGASQTPVAFATTSEGKLREVEGLGLAVQPVALELTEIQGTAEQVLAAKAIEAYHLNGPTLVEDTSLVFQGMPGEFPGINAKQHLGTEAAREEWCQRIPADDRRATFRVGFAISLDGKTVITKWGETEGQIAPHLQVSDDPERRAFGFDDMFIPAEEVARAATLGETPRTYAQMKPGEKAQTSARARAVAALVEARIPLSRDAELQVPMNPHGKAFEDFIRAGETRDPRYYHPYLQERERQIEQINAVIPDLPEYVPPALHPHAPDRGLVVTPFDDVPEGARVVIPDQMYVEGWQRQSEFYLKLANHPARVWAMQQLEARGFQPPPELPNGVIDAEVAAGRIVQLADLGQANGFRRDAASQVKIRHLADDLRLLQQAARDTQLAGSERVQAAQARLDAALAAIPDQVHRTELLYNGPFTLVRGRAFSFIGGGSNPDIFGNVLAGETAAKMGVMFGVPEVGEFSNIERQVALAREILANLTIDDPILEGRSLEERQYIVDHWRACVTGVVEGSPKKAVERARKLAEVGVQTFRVYQHTKGGEVLETVKLLRQEFPDAIIIASQITDEETAILAEYAGADAIITGVGSGGRCTTAALSQLVPTNAPLAWDLRGKIGIPVIGEGGVVDNPVVGMLTGFSMANGSGVFGGTLEVGGIYALTDSPEDRPDMEIYWPYDGEASEPMKARSEVQVQKGGRTVTQRRTLRTGEAFTPEGGAGRKYLTRMHESMAKAIYDAWIRVNMGLVVLGVDMGPYSVQVAQGLNPSPLVLNTMAGIAAADLH